MPSRFEISISSGQFDSNRMSLCVFVNENLVYNDPVDWDSKVIEFTTDLPAQIKFVVDGKGDFDTKVDEQGCIIEDKFIRIDRLVVDRMPVQHYLLENTVFKFTPSNPSKPSICSNYFGYNGVAILELKNNTSFNWFLNLLIDR